MEINFEKTTKEANEINVNINDLTINLKATNNPTINKNLKLKNDKSNEDQEDLEISEKEKDSLIKIENKKNKLREKCDFCKARNKNTRGLYQKSIIKTNSKNDLLGDYNNNNNNNLPEDLLSNNTDNLNNLNNNNNIILNNLYKRQLQIRQNYLSKLVCSNIWVPNMKKKTNNSIIIFDWDDTLLCTTFLTPNGIFYDNLKIDKRDLEKITKLESLTYDILKTSIDCGDTFIVTNAAPGWVEYSTRRFYPKVYPLLSKLNILSARGEFEKKFPGDSRQWKILTFLRLLKIMDTNLITNFICLGDSLIEMEAAHIFASKFSKIYIKTVKFRENPSPEELFKQLQLINGQFHSIYSAVKNLTIKVERKNKPNNTIKSTNTSFDPNNSSNYDITQIRNSLASSIASEVVKKK